MATYAIGDIHGQAAALDALLARVVPLLTAGDHLVFLGDYVDRGPDSKGVLDALLRTRDTAPCDVRFLLGNHEEWLLHCLDDPTRHSRFVGMEGATTVASYSEEAAEALKAEVAAKGFDLIKDKLPLPYERFFDAVPPAHLDLLRNLEPFVRTDDIVCVHAGADDGVPVEAQPTKSVVWGDRSFPEAYTGPDRIVYGHWNDAVVLGEQVSPKRNAAGTTYGVDSVARGYLTCLRLPDEAVFTAPV